MKLRGTALIATGASLLFALFFSVLYCLPAAAQTGSGFSLQVTPSPIITSVTPGEKKTIELKIRNTNTVAEKLKISLRSFTVDDASSDISLGDGAPAEVAAWVTFKDPTFTVDAGQWFTEQITLNTPKDAGFSYSFAIVIARQNPAVPQGGTTAAEGSVAIFTLIGVDKPGATRKLDILEVRSSKRAYEYLPAVIDVKLKNSGNTLVQPRGNIYIQRGSNDAEPITVLPLNEKDSYLTPDTTRTLQASWNDGFPAYVTKSDNGTTATQLVWNWDSVSKLRIGRYVAKVVAVYDDGDRDIPVEAEVSFWVIPWKLLIGLVVIIILLTVGIVTIIKKSYFVARRKRHEKTSAE